MGGTAGWTPTGEEADHEQDEDRAYDAGGICGTDAEEHIAN
jgi:hypothetical protein